METIFQNILTKAQYLSNTLGRWLAIEGLLPQMQPLHHICLIISAGVVIYALVVLFGSGLKLQVQHLGKL